MTTPQPLREIPRTLLGEGPHWDGRRLLYVDIRAGEIHRHTFANPGSGPGDCASPAHEVLRVGTPVGFAVLDENEAVIAGVAEGAIHRLHFDSAAREVVALAARDNPDNLANDGKCDRRGRLWAGTKNIDETASASGSLTRLDTQRETQPETQPDIQSDTKRDIKLGGHRRLTEILYPVFVSNGLAWSPDNTRMYYSESTDKIWIFDYDLDTGEASNQRIFVRLPADGALPDGMTIDGEGHLYVAMWGGSRVDVYRDDLGEGTLVETIPLPTALQVSSVAFGGVDLRTLFITTAAVDLTPEQWTLYPDSGLLFAVRRDIAGLRETPFSPAGQA